MARAFGENLPISTAVSVFLGMTTSDNELFVRCWWEVSESLFTKTANSVDQIRKWAPYNKGGDFRRWFGNQQFVVNWENDGFAIRNNKDGNGRIRSTVPTAVTSLKDCITWSKISSGRIALRYFPRGSLFDVAGACCFGQRKNLCLVMGFLNSSVAMAALSFMSPTLNFEGGQVRSLPLRPLSEEDEEKVVSYVEKQIIAAKADWDSFEQSWGFVRHPLG